MMLYRHLVVPLRRVFDSKFRGERNKFLSERASRYRWVGEYMSEGLTKQSMEIKRELEEKEQHFGISRDDSLYFSGGLIPIRLT